MYLLKRVEVEKKSPEVQLLGSGTILRESIEAARILAEDFNISSSVWSVTSFNELRKNAQEFDRSTFRAAEIQAEEPWVTKMLKDKVGPVVASTDYTKMYVDQIRKWVPNDYYVLGTDGFGRSDSRGALREFFEIDRNNIAATAIFGLYNEGKVSREFLLDGYQKLGIDSNKSSPVYS